MGGMEGRVCGFIAGMVVGFVEEDMSIMLLKRFSGLGMLAVSGVGVGWESFRIAIHPHHTH